MNTFLGKRLPLRQANELKQIQRLEIYLQEQQICNILKLQSRRHQRKIVYPFTQFNAKRSCPFYENTKNKKMRVG